jgi:selenocysteine lyase/cysteine desulfurase
MGYETLATAAVPVWQRYAEEFPVTANLVYLNHAAVAPLVKRSADAMKRLADDACLFGSYHYNEWLDAYEGCARRRRLIQADRGEIAIVKNTSEGISTLATGLDWRSGDVVVAFAEEFPANYYPWRRLRPRGHGEVALPPTHSKPSTKPAAERGCSQLAT